MINLAPVIEVEREALLCADPLVVNEHEAGLVIEQLGGSANLSAPEDQLAALLRAGFASVVITLGAAGALVGETGKDTPILVDSPRVRAVDSVGAGDAFTGALCHELVRGTTLVEATAVACRVGAFSVTRNGAQPSYPHAADVLPV